MAFTIGQLTLDLAGATDVGLKRKHNEDALYMADDECFLVVADGMGGHSAGDIASQLAIDTVSNHFRATFNGPERTWPFVLDDEDCKQDSRLATAIQLANQEIFEAAQRERRPGGMGTTIVATLFYDDKLLMGHVGDSRIYRVRQGEIEQLTEDHSLLNDYIKMKRISPEEIEKFPHHNVIVRALGMKDNVAIDLLHGVVHPGDRYLLCSDGLSGMMSDEDILAIVSDQQDLSACCNQLIAKANENGGKDNITVAMAYVRS